MSLERELVKQLHSTAADIHPSPDLDRAVRDNYRRFIAQSRSRRSVVARVSAWMATGIALTAGGALAAGFTSPAIAQVLRKIPLISGVADALYAGAPTAVQTAIRHGFNIPIGRSITRDGITLTVTNAYFGPEQLWIGVTESFPKGAGKHRAIPFGKIAVLLDGHAPAVYGYGVQLKPMRGGGYAGTIGVGNMNASPSVKLAAALNVHLAGGVGGSWDFKFPLSRAAAISATRTWNPHIARSFEGSTWSVDKVGITPASVLLQGIMTTPGHIQPNLVIRVSAQTGALPYAPVNLTLLRQTSHTSTWQYVASMERVSPLPKALSLVPEFFSPDYMLPVPDASTRLSTDYTFFPGTGRQMTITRIARSRAAIEIYYSTVGNQYKQDNPYALALFNGGDTRSTARIAYPTECRVANSLRHEAVLVFPGHANWKHASVRYYPPGLPANPLSYRKGVVAQAVPAPALTLHVPLH